MLYLINWTRIDLLFVVLFCIVKKTLATAKSTSPVNTLSASSGVSLNNSNSTSPCGTLTTSRRRSVDSKSPQPSGEQFTKTSGN